MAIEPRYMEMIEQCEARIDELSEWEREQFIKGWNEKKKEYGTPLSGRPYLSSRQKEILEKIVEERLNGRKYTASLDHGAISAVHNRETGYIVTVAENPVGAGLSRKEAAIVTMWLHGAMRDIITLPQEATKGYEGPPDDSNGVVGLECDAPKTTTKAPLPF